MSRYTDFCSYFLKNDRSALSNISPDAKRLPHSSALYRFWLTGLNSNYASFSKSILEPYGDLLVNGICPVAAARGAEGSAVPVGNALRQNWGDLPRPSKCRRELCQHDSENWNKTTCSVTFGTPCTLRWWIVPNPRTIRTGTRPFLCPCSKRLLAKLSTFKFDYFTIGYYGI